MPDRRSPEEIKKSFELAKKMQERSKKKENEKSIKYAKNALIFVAVIQFLVGLYEGFVDPKMIEALIIDFAIGGLFLGMFFYAKTEPLKAFVISLSVYGGIVLIMAAIDPTTILQGIIVKFLVIGGLISGIQAARKMPKPKPKLDEELLDDID